ncbi:MAG: AmmeMemoRadiSam system radical SAM enzyme [Candidatus Bathyarchaeota archaeon]|nr:MAG: AmmeMemoRadiSam system radical SAM enzyme [Candidatus Bathyarchaeota archaeon]
MKEAMFYEKSGDNMVECNLCSHRCRIADSKRGICAVRENRKGMLYSLVYGKAVARAVDPIEKKPLFHFLPSSMAYSIATVGCNFNCGNCQNFDISQIPKERNVILGQVVAPEEIVEAAKRYNCESIAYTYSEPTIFFEYAYDAARLARKEGIKNIFVTNGYITEEALVEMKPYLDAANIDLKSFSEDFYRKNCGARLGSVLDSIRLHKSLGIWIEITTLIIPTLNDSDEELRNIAGFIKEVGEEIPWHISQFHPTYKIIDLPRTPITTLRRAREIGLKVGLRYVYEGNVPGEAGEHTYCHKCGKKLIHRFGYQVLENKVKDSTCSYCGAKIDGVGI